MQFFNYVPVGVEVIVSEGVRFEREVLGSQIVNPEPFRPGFFSGFFPVEEEDVCLNALGVEDAGGKSQESVNVAFSQELLSDGFSCSPLL